MQVDIYDFDHTLFPMDSGSRLFGYCMRHYPCILVFAPFQMIMAVSYTHLDVYKRQALLLPDISNPPS